jgi:hypothetical protein
MLQQFLHRHSHKVVRGFSNAEEHWQFGKTQDTLGMSSYGLQERATSLNRNNVPNAASEVCNIELRSGFRSDESVLSPNALVLKKCSDVWVIRQQFGRLLLGM